MSVESFKQFGQKVADDESIREKVKAIGQTNIDGIIAYANQLGYSFTVDDMIATAKEAGINADELNEEQLEKVAGGAVTVIAVITAATTVATHVAQGVVKNW